MGLAARAPMQSWSAGSLAVIALLTTSGCATYGGHSHHRHGHSTSAGGAEAVAFGVGLFAAIVASRERPDPREPLVVQPRIYVNAGRPAPPLPASTRDRVVVDEGLPSFDPVSARNALAKVDVTSCKTADCDAVCTRRILGTAR